MLLLDINEKLKGFYSQVRNPFDILEIKETKQALKELLINIHSRPVQNDLFNSPEDLVEKILSEMHEDYIDKGLYRTWKKKDPTGKETSYANPNPCLARFSKNYLIPLIKKFQQHEKCHGGEKIWTAEKSLKTHIPFSVVLSFDIKSAFNNINLEHAFSFYHNLLNELPEEHRLLISGFLADLSTVPYEGKKVIPRGSNHSMALFNRIMRFIDDEIDPKASERDMHYTRWVDDLIISSQRIKDPEEFVGAIALTQEHLSIATKKIYFQKSDRYVFLLKHKIDNERIFKDESPLNTPREECHLNYFEWFGPSNTKNFEPW